MCDKKCGKKGSADWRKLPGSYRADEVKELLDPTKSYRVEVGVRTSEDVALWHVFEWVVEGVSDTTRSVQTVDVQVARERLAEVRREIESHSLGDRPSAPPAGLLREEAELVALVNEASPHDEPIQPCILSAPGDPRHSLAKTLKERVRQCARLVAESEVSKLREDAERARCAGKEKDALIYEKYAANAAWRDGMLSVERLNYYRSLATEPAFRTGGASADFVSRNSDAVLDGLLQVLAYADMLYVDVHAWARRASAVEERRA